MLVLVLISFVAASSMEAISAELNFTAIFVFGDSRSDPGNNNYFIKSLAKANFPPYGVDSEQGATGRFCNGKILVDFIGEYVGFPIIPSYVETIINGADIGSGVNYASAAAGILVSTGYAYGRIVPLIEQVSNFKNTLSQLRTRMAEEELSKFLAKALVVMDIGANDYLNNYLQPLLYKTSLTYSPSQFSDLLIERYNGFILELHDAGLRKFLVAEVGPIGCIPAEITMNGECNSSDNELLQMLNVRLKSMVSKLNSDYPAASAFTLAASFRMFQNLRDNATAYGFKVKNTGCCGATKNGHTFLCVKNSVPCEDREEYLFWDFAHPTEAANRIFADWIFHNTSYTSPFSIQQMAVV